MVIYTQQSLLGQIRALIDYHRQFWGRPPNYLYVTPFNWSLLAQAKELFGVAIVLVSTATTLYVSD